MLTTQNQPGDLSILALTVLLLLALSGCAADGGAQKSTEDNQCFGMAPAIGLPERVGGFEFGRIHDLGGGNVIDLSEFSGCELPDGGGVVVLLGGEFASVYHLDCEHLATSDIPLEVRPDHDWLCYGPGGGLERSAP